MEEKLTDLILSNIEKGNYGFIIVIIFTMVLAIIIFRFRGVLEYLSERRNFRRKFLEEVIANTKHKSNVRYFLENELIREYFARIFKFNAEVIIIEKIIDFHKFLNGEFTFNQLVKSYRYMRMNDGKLTIHISWLDWLVDAFTYYILAFILFCLGVYSYILGFKHDNWKILLYILCAFFNILLSLIIYFQSIPYKNAKKLKLRLEAFQKQTVAYMTNRMRGYATHTT